MGSSVEGYDRYDMFTVLPFGLSSSVKKCKRLIKWAVSNEMNTLPVRLIFVLMYHDAHLYIMVLNLSVNKSYENHSYLDDVC